MLGSLLDQVFRRESGRVLATLIRHFGDFDLAEDALQDACAKALTAWPQEGIPANPAAWLTTVAQRRGIDVKRRQRVQETLPDIASEIDDREPGSAVTSGVDDASDFSSPAVTRL